ncbi:hypothetical protein [Mesobacillus thioparans]|uniref:hypothetical protein n=1 Tax=Mesobacillus thioparans TaxID=370439 RepID=UPI0039EF9E98
MFKVFISLKYKVHLFLRNYNEALMQDAICDKLKVHLKQKASYHRQQAFSLISKM